LAAFKLVQFLGLGPALRLMKPNCMLRTDGWYASVQKLQAIDAEGMPIPWLTYGAIAFLEERLKDTFEVFEYGAGNSTIWYSRRVKKITAVEHVAVWAEIAGRNLNGSGTVLMREIEGERDYEKITYRGLEERNHYTNAIKETDTRYQVIVVDGVYRNACTVIALERLADEGVLVVDNTDYEEFSVAMQFLIESGFRVIHFPGMAPITQRRCRTSVFYRDGNCFNI